MGVVLPAANGVTYHRGGYGDEMTEDFGIDLDEVFKVIEAADILIIRLHLIQARLLIDFRSQRGTGPYIGLVPRAESVEDRFRSIKQLRPEFPFPDKVMSFRWPRTAPVLKVSGIWDRIVGRMSAAGGVSSVAECEEAMTLLVQDERRETVDAIRGADHYQTLWERPGRGR